MSPCRSAAYELQNSKYIDLVSDTRPAYMFDVKLRTYLLQVQAMTGVTEGLVQDRYGEGSNRCTTLKRSIAKANHTPWVKLLQSCRNSCENDLLDEFPARSVASWIGHSETVQRNFYLRLSDDHFRRPRVKIRVSLCKIERDCLGQATRQIKKNAVICRAGTQSVPSGPEHSAARLGLEPRTTEPESAVLPITPSGSTRLILRDAGEKARFALPDR